MGTDGTLASSTDPSLTFTYYAGSGTTGTSLGDAVPTNVGTYTVVAHYAGSVDYFAADSNPVTFDITKATPTVGATDAGGVYTSFAFPASATVTGVGTDSTLASSSNAALTFIYYVGSGTTGANLGDVAPTNVGTYTVVAHYAGSARLLRSRQQR